MRNNIVTALLSVSVFLLGSTAVLAQTQAPPAQQQSASGIRWEGWGVRAGLSANPDQVYGGVHFNLGEFAKNVRFRPTVEVGFGDDRTTFQALAEAHYIFSKVQVWKPYVGGGLGMTYVTRDDDCCGNHHEEGSDTEFALMGIGGMETKLKSGNAFFMELKVGLGDEDPDVKFGVGWSFK